MEEERGGGAVDVKLMSLDSSDTAQQQLSVCVWLVCVRRSTESGTSRWVSEGQGHITDITSPPEPHTQLCEAGGAVCTNMTDVAIQWMTEVPTPSSPLSLFIALRPRMITPLLYLIKFLAKSTPKQKSVILSDRLLPSLMCHMMNISIMYHR